MPQNRFKDMFQQQGPNPQELIKKAHRSGMNLGFAIGFSLGIVVIEVIVHLFPF